MPGVAPEILGGIALVLAALAIALAAPVPLVLARAPWPSRAPARALLLWQLIALAGGVGTIGALVLGGLALASLSSLAGGIVIGLGVAFAGYLLGHLAVTIVSVTRQRRRHHALLRLLTDPHPTQRSTRVLDDAAPIAYCLPRGAGSLTVLSSGLLEKLSPAELAAVVAHERAHATQRHDVLLVSFRAWRSALPWFPIAGRAESEVAVLVEMLADDSARRETDDLVLAHAILAVSGGAGGSVIDLAVHRRSGRASDRVRRLVG